MRTASLSAAAFALCVLGCPHGDDRAAKKRVSAPWFEELAAERGLRCAHASDPAGTSRLPELLGGGAALLDADGDGDLDAFLVLGGRSAESRGSNALFENTGGGWFRAVATPGGRGHGMGVTAGDADEDGDTDLYVTSVGPNALLENLGALRFTDAAERAGVGHRGWSTSAAFLDADRDGDLDLFLASYFDGASDGSEHDGAPGRAVFYVNLGRGRFADASEPSGIAGKRGHGLGVAVGDVDENGWLDVFVANDGGANHLWRNQGALVFEERGMLADGGASSSGEKAGSGVVLADLDHDLDLDLLVCNRAGESDALLVNAQGAFADRAAFAGFAPVSRVFTRFGVGACDFDHDGELDLFEATGRVESATTPRTSAVQAEENLLFRGLGFARWAEVPLRGGVAEPLAATSRAAAFGDVDDDGALDVLVVNRDGPPHLLRNLAGGAGHWILLRVCEASGRDALGASVELALARGPVRREVSSASSYLAASDPRVHVGLGSETRVARVTVRWVDGARESFGPLPADQLHQLRRGAGLPSD